MEFDLNPPIHDGTEERESQLISEIIVGPCPHPELAIRAVQMLLESNGVKAEVKKSQIPYRGW